ncbi:MAG: peptidylprolyl isomerase [Sphaerochaetaceae bacterium]
MSANDNTNGKKPEDTEKVLSFGKGKKSAVETKGKNEAALKPKRKITIGWVFGMIVLILIAISFVLAPAIQAFVGQSTSNGVVFGKYGKEEIKYTYGNYFYDQVQNYANQYEGSQTNQTQALYQIWKSAYDSTVLFTAINQLASKAGIIAADEVVKRAIIESGAYDKDGAFDVKTYQEASAETKTSVERFIRRGLPYQIVIDDVGTVLSSTSEKDYIADMAGNGRTFRYLSIDPTLYPDELAAQYALQNKQLFYSMDMSVISVDSQESAQDMYDAIVGGETSFEDAAIANSLDSYATEGGNVGQLYYYGIISNFKNPDDAVVLLSAKNGDILGPFESNNSWTLYKMNSTPEEADYTSEELLASVKAYLAVNDSAIIDTYLADLAGQLQEQIASEGLDEVALEQDLSVVDVSATPYNLGQSNYMSNFSYTDNAGLLANAASNEEVAQQLYTAEENTLLDPIKSGTSYLLVEVGANVQDDTMGSYISMFYDYYSGAQNQQDFSQALYTSDAFEDNFLTTFLNVVLGQGE